jgi:hypothetical protein
VPTKVLPKYYREPIEPITKHEKRKVLQEVKPPTEKTKAIKLPNGATIFTSDFTTPDYIQADAYMDKLIKANKWHSGVFKGGKFILPNNEQ